MRYRVRHETLYRYGTPVSTGHHRLNLAPRELADQHVRSFEVAIEPAPSFRVDRADAFGNATTYLELDGPHDSLGVTSTSVVEVAAVGDLPEGTAPWDEIRDHLWHGAGAPEAVESMAFAVASPHVQLDRAITRYASTSFPAGRPIAEAAMELTQRIHDDFEFEPEATTVSTPVREVFEQRKGVCQDFAHLQLTCLRGLGLPARYVSGYLRTDPPPGRPRLVGVDASHAWVSVYAAAHGWIDLDPTNACTRGDRHVVLGWGRDFADVSPVKGQVLAAGHHDLEVSVDVVPIDAAPVAAAPATDPPP